MDNAGYVALGYALTGVSIGGYLLALLNRARHARASAKAVAASRLDRGIS